MTCHHKGEDQCDLCRRETRFLSRQNVRTVPPSAAARDFQPWLLPMLDFPGTPAGQRSGWMTEAGVHGMETRFPSASVQHRKLYNAVQYCRKKPKHSKAQSTMPTSRDVPFSPNCITPTSPKLPVQGSFGKVGVMEFGLKGTSRLVADVTGSRHSGLGFTVFWLFTAEYWTVKHNTYRD